MNRERFWLRGINTSAVFWSEAVLGRVSCADVTCLPGATADQVDLDPNNSVIYW